MCLGMAQQSWRVLGPKTRRWSERRAAPRPNNRPYARDSVSADARDRRRLLAHIGVAHTGTAEEAPAGQEAAGAREEG